MRQLNIDETLDEIIDYSNRLEFADGSKLSYTSIEFWEFLDNESICKRILKKIEDDFSYLKVQIFNYDSRKFLTHASKITSYILTAPLREKQAFSFFIMQDHFQNNKTCSQIENTLIAKWYSEVSYSDRRDYYIDHCIKPFVKLLKWYITESTSSNEQDYFSKKEIDELYVRLDNLKEELYNEIKTDIENGQEILFDEIQELKELLNNNKKKNWREILTTKLILLAGKQIISSDAVSSAFKSLINIDQDFDVKEIYTHVTNYLQTTF